MDAGFALLGAAFHQRIGQDELGFGDPGEGDQGGLGLAFQIDGDVLVLDPGQLAAEALAALGQAVQLQPRLEALIGHEVLQPGQRPVDAGAGDFQEVVAFDRVGGVQHLRDGARQPRAILDIHVAVRAFGHDLQPA